MRRATNTRDIVFEKMAGEDVMSRFIAYLARVAGFNGTSRADAGELVAD